MKEQWKIINNGFANYAISTNGRVRNLTTGRVLKHSYSKSGGGYAYITLCRDGQKLKFNVYILVANAFLLPCETDYEIHHKDRNRKNPKFENLQRLTHQEHLWAHNKEEKRDD